ncbi:terminase [Streptomyces sp. NPDC058620]|uniref:terminase n=1 Tax=Streptomyces sp. NPDC058620 TaxID=3346560 RepID=UPI0036612239
MTTTMTTSVTSEGSEKTWEAPPEFAQQCLDLYGLTCPPRWGTPRRPEFESLGPAAWRVMERLGFPPMPWQRYVLDVALEIDPATGVFAHREVGLSVPRQQGKTQQILGLMVHRMAAGQRQNIIYAAQNRIMARKRWEDEFLATIETSPLSRRITSRKANGSEAIIWKRTRSRLGITANTESAGHGPALDLGVIDEAFAAEDDRLEQAFSPAMLTRLKAQLWWASAGGTEKSVWLNGKRKTGRALIEALWASGARPRTAYFEWFAPEEMDRADPATWRACLPALGYTVSEDIIAAELEKMAADPGAFDRAYLNRTRKATPPVDPNVPKKMWPGLVDAASRPGEDMAFSIDVSQDRAWSSIGMASVRDDGLVHLEVLDRRAGTAWVVPAITRLAELWNPLVVAVAGSGSPAASLIDDLQTAGIKVPEGKDHPNRGHLVILRSGDASEACGQIADAMNQNTARHLDQTPLTASVNGARSRRIGDAWTIDRTNSLTDASAFAAVTWARWALLTKGPLVLDDYDVLDSIG